MRRSLGQVIVCLRKTQRSLSRNFPFRTPGRILSGKSRSRELRQTLDVSSVVHRSLGDRYVSLIVTEEKIQLLADYQR